MAALGLICLCLSVYEGVIGTDAIARGGEERLVRAGWAERQAEIGAAIAAEVDWDEAAQRLGEALDPDWARGNIGVFLTQNEGFEQVAILDHAGAPVYAMAKGEIVPPARLAPTLAAAAPLVRQVRTQEAARGPNPPRARTGELIVKPIQASAVTQIGGRSTLLYATLVQPDSDAVKPLHRTAPVVIAAEPIGAGEMTQMAERYRLDHARLAPAAEPLANGEASVIIPDTGGTGTLSIRWRPERPGADFFRRTGAVGIGVLLVFVAILIVFFRSTRHAYAELVDSRAQLKAALQASQDASLAKSEFLASMSHEIRTPLNGVMGALHLLKREPMSAEGTMLLETAHVSGQMVGALINDVLDFSKIEAGRMVISTGSADLAAVLRGVADQFVAACEAKGVAFVLNIRGDLGWAEVDALRLRQCLYNLIGNAVKFTAKGQVTVSVRTDTRAAGRMLCVSVADTGIGIDALAMESLFERFKQADGSTTRRFGGSGLGLAITRQLAELMGGQVGFISKAGQGSTFTLEVLAPACAPGVAEIAPEAQEPDEAPLADVAVLVVDDNATNRLIAGKILERLGAVVTTAESGPEAIERAGTMVFDLILMDIQMPGMDGVETTRRLRRDTAVGASTPILALTANVFDDQRQSYLAAGMDGVVAKPISPADLLAEISRAVGASDERERASG